MSFFLCNALGFFIQFYPCMLVIFLPFSEETLRFPRKRIFIGITLTAAALAVVFPWMLHWADGNITIGIIANFYMLCAILLGLLAFVSLIRETIIKKVLAFYAVLFYSVTQYYLVSTVSLLYGGSPFTAYSSFDVLAYAGTTALLMPLEFAVIVRPLREFSRETELLTMQREFTITIVSTTACFILMFYYNTMWQSNLRMENFFSWVIPLSIFLIFNQGVIYWLVFRESVRRRHEDERQHFLEVQRLQYDKIAGEMENTRRLRHDLRHHLTVLGALNAQGKQEEITDYLKQYVTVYDRLAAQKLSGDPIVDSVLEYYLTLVEEEDIPVDCQVQLNRSSGVDAIDMTVLLGNCLENALEALRLLPAAERQLSIEMMPVKSMILLRIQNTCIQTDCNTEPAGWDTFVSHKGKSRKGVGLHSVTTIAEKYGGSAQFQYKDGVFITRVILAPPAYFGNVRI